MRSMLSKKTMRIPRGFLEDLSSVIFKHDVLFLEAVCRELNIPFREAKNKVLGLGEECPLEVTSDLSDGSTQCEFWILNPETMLYKQCPARQMIQCSGCELHNSYNTITSSKNHILKKEDIADLPELDWFYHEIKKQHFLYNSVQKRFFTKDCAPADGYLWENKETEMLYRIVVNPKALYKYKKLKAARTVEHKLPKPQNN
jgi:hypothetical protein